jgi:hypothetical protein
VDFTKETGAKMPMLIGVTLLDGDSNVYPARNTHELANKSNHSKIGSHHGVAAIAL